MGARADSEVINQLPNRIYYWSFSWTFKRINFFKQIFYSRFCSVLGI